MTFLKKLGSFLAKAGIVAGDVAGILAGVGPIITPLLGAKAGPIIGTIINDLTAVGKVVVMAEALLQTPGSGAQKLAAATPLVANIIKTSELVSGHKIADEALFTAGCAKITSGTADILNSLSPDKVPNP